MPVARGSGKGAAGIDIGAGAGVAEPRQRRHDSSIKRELGTAPEEEAVRDNFDAPRVGDRNFYLWSMHTNLASNLMICSGGSGGCLKCLCVIETPCIL